MRLLYFDGASQCHLDKEGKRYVGSNLEGSVIKRYGQYCTDFAVMLIEDTTSYSEEEAQTRFNSIDQDLAEVIIVPDIKQPRRNLLNLKLRRKVMKVMADAIQEADRVIVRAPGRFYTNTALRLCRKYNKVYLIEAVDFVLDYLSFGRIMKFIAPYAEFIAKREIARAPYVVYVSQHTLQERYPTNGKSLGCSDVELPDLDESLPAKRMLRKPGSSLILGTAAGIGKLKGQEYVIRAIGELRKQSITNLEYHLAGGISPKFQHRLGQLMKALHVEDSIKFCGPIPHERIFDWYDQLDVYIQPSFTEALGRSVIEAMSRALPAACASVGGMVEYASDNLFFQPGNVEQICIVLKKLLDPKVRRLESERSFTKAGEFAKSRLDPIRNKFYMDFMHS